MVEHVYIGLLESFIISVKKFKNVGTFFFEKNGFYAFVDMLTDAQVESLKKRIKSKYNLTVDSDQIYLQHIQTDFSGPPPPPPNSMQDVYNNPYYYIYSYQIIVDMMNNALSQAMQSLVTKSAFYGQTLPTENPPFFEFDMDNSKFILSLLYYKLTNY